MWRAEEVGRAFRVGAAATVGVVAVLAALLAVYAVRQVLILALIALFVAVSLEPAVRGLIRLHVSRGWAVTIVLIGLTLLVAGFVAAVVPAVVSQGDQLIQRLPGYLEQARQKSQTIEFLGKNVPITEKVTEWVASLPGRIGSSLFSFAGRFFGALSATLLVMVLATYFLADLPRLRRGAVALFPQRHRASARVGVNVVVDKVGGYMIGNLVISLIAGVSSLIVLMALQVPYPITLAVIVAVMDLVPLVGATLGAILCTIIAAFSVDIWPIAALLAVFFIAYQQLENYWIAPRVLRSSVELPAVSVLLAGLIGATLLGLVGALMAIPLAAAIRVLMSAQLRAEAREAQPPPEEETLKLLKQPEPDPLA